MKWSVSEMTQQQGAKRRDFGPTWPEVTGLGEHQQARVHMHLPCLLFAVTVVIAGKRYGMNYPKLLQKGDVIGAYAPSSGVLGG